MLLLQEATDQKALKYFKILQLQLQLRDLTGFEEVDRICCFSCCCCCCRCCVILTSNIHVKHTNMENFLESEDPNKETGALLPRRPEGEGACQGEGEGAGEGEGEGAGGCGAPSTLKRWYILAQFAFFGLLQNAVWNTYGPILLSTRQAFGWTVGDIALIPNIGNISLVLTIPVGSWFVSKFGKYKGGCKRFEARNEIAN